MLPENILCCLSWLSNNAYISEFEQLTKDTELWLPIDFNFMFLGKDVSGNSIFIGSVFEWSRSIEKLNHGTWLANIDEIKSWRKEIDPNTKSFNQKAKFAFSIVSNLTMFSINNLVPLKLDY